MKRRSAGMYRREKGHRRATKRFALFLVTTLLLVVGIFAGEHFFFGAASEAKNETILKSGPAWAKNSATEQEPAKEEGFLFLVNWEHRVSGGEPGGLVRLDTLFEADVIEDIPNGLVNQTAGAAARQMFADAEEDGITGYKINSAYRSLEYQEQLWRRRLREEPSYGSDPFEEPVRVMPGDASEHCTGLALDILARAYDCADDGFGNTPEGHWLAQHAWQYGFILRYPQDKEKRTGVIYEPWHYRFVGTDAAKEIFESGKCLEEYMEER